MSVYYLNAASYIVTQLCILLGGPDAVIMGGGVKNSIYTNDTYCINVLNTAQPINNIIQKAFKEASENYNVSFTHTSTSNNRYCIKGNMHETKPFNLSKEDMQYLKPGKYPTWILLPTVPSKEREL